MWFLMSCIYAKDPHRQSQSTPILYILYSYHQQICITIHPPLLLAIGRTSFPISGPIPGPNHGVQSHIYRVAGEE